jgi:putative undecaprenyl diphosphate synthase
LLEGLAPAIAALPSTAIFSVDDILDWCAELRIRAVTLWVFSTENLKRSQAEVSGILSAIEARRHLVVFADPVIQVACSWSIERHLPAERDAVELAQHQSCESARRYRGLQALGRNAHEQQSGGVAARIPGSLPNAQDDALLLRPNHQVGPLGEYRFNVLQIGVDGR